MVACYAVFYLFTAFFEKETVNYRFFYMLCLMLLTITFAFDTIAPVAGCMDTALFSRNGWFVGLPMFGIGLFIREYQEHIFSAFGVTTAKSVLLLVIGITLSVLQNLTVGNGVIPFGTLIGVVALMLVLVSHPVIVHSAKLARLVLSLGPISTWIYLVHLLFIMAYEKFLRSPFTSLLGAKEPYLFPLTVALLSLVTAIFCNALSLRLPKSSQKQ